MTTLLTMERRNGVAVEPTLIGLRLISGGEKGNKVTPDARLGSAQPSKLTTYTPMRLCYLAGLLEDISLGSMEHGKVGFVCGNMSERYDHKSFGRQRA